MAPSTDVSQAAERRRGLSLRTKALGLLLVVAVAPTAIMAGSTLRGYGDSVRSNEERMQLLVVRDVASDVERFLEQADGDLRAVAGTVAVASDGAASDDAVLAAIRAALAARSSLAGIRLEIPSTSASIPFVKEGLDPSAFPGSTPALRAEADAHGSALGAIDGGRAILVARVAPTATSATARPQAYVVAPLWLAPLGDDLVEAIERNGAGGDATRAVLIDDTKHTVATYPKPADAAGPSTGQGPDAGGLAVWSLLEATSGDGSAVGSSSLGAAGIYYDQGEARFGTIHSIGQRRWAVAMSRPADVALAEYHSVKLIALTSGLLVLVFAALAGVIASRAITAPVLDIVARVRLVGARKWRELSPMPPRGDELGDLSLAIDRMATDLETSEERLQREAQLRGDLSRFLGAELVDAIVRGEHSLALGGERRVVTILFADVVAFTPIAAQGRPEVVVAMLNELFTILSEVVFRHGGTVDKFVGDSIMAVFGAPVSRADHADRALRAAEDMIRFTETAAEEWKERFGVEVFVGIGVNSGEVIVGNIGSKKRMEYTVIGDAVNVAARLEALAAKSQVLVGRATADLCEGRAALTFLGERRLSGRSDTTGVYELTP